MTEDSEKFTREWGSAESGQEWLNWKAKQDGQWSKWSKFKTKQEYDVAVQRSKDQQK
jgi:hypothetical protein